MSDLKTVPLNEMTREQFQSHLDNRSVNTHDAARVAAFFSENAVQRRVATGETVRGREAIREAMAELFRMFPDFHLEVLDLFSAGSRMCVQCTLTGTNDGELFGLPPTHRGIEVELCLVFRLNRDGLVEQETVYSDSAITLRQLGLMGGQ